MADAKPRIVVAEKFTDSAMTRLAAAGDVVLLNRPTEDELISEVANADALAVRTYVHVTPRVVEAARRTGRLKVIGRGGVGVDNIDVAAAVAAGITVVNTPAACTHAVADLAVGLMIAVQRKIVEFEPRLRHGEFSSLRSEAPQAVELRHQTLGVIGMGRIGRAVSGRLHLGFGTRVIYYDIREVGYLPFAAEPQGSAEAVYANADIVTLHVPLTGLTRGMIDARALSHFRKTAILVNTSRGPVVQASPLAEALKEGRLGGAAIDVFDPEPPPPDHPLFSAPNCVLTPHVASRSREGVAAMNDVVDDIIAILQGREPMYPVDPANC
jgi:D-3-phosphoglycerate dehydrogenase